MRIPLLETNRAVMTLVSGLSKSKIFTRHQFLSARERKKLGYMKVGPCWYGGNDRHCDEGWIIENLEENERF